ncbi:glutathione S-transferase family protein [Inhella proteolytica]|uniref:Glutathione S-transferase family protein n=1 Tax=Inhella proteolytica TaxID=2795029 RepID=A0A931NDK0_9BURK|nr:glutathione S-transferase family protein [Inhella proteolytica]MBH9576752.1 glutathione S-transferase family protein [Inhella proteolytica]
MIQLHFSPSSAAMAPHFLLRELDLPHELVRVDVAGGEHRREPYLKLNPNGQIPVLVDGDLVLHQTAAILLHLSDQAGRLLPAVGSRERALAYQWLIWLTNTLQPALINYFYPERWDAERPAQIKAQAEAKVLEMLQQLDDQLARHGQPWLLGSEFTAVDCLAFTLCRWTRNFAGKKARDFPHIGPYLQRVVARPALQKVFEVEGLVAPFC